jgi:hypothetical protein
MNRAESIVARYCLLALVLLGHGVTRAADRYVCECGEGASAGCIVGDDLADGLSEQSPWRSYERARQAFAALAPGEAIRFCRGGVFAIGSATRWVNSTCRAEAPCTIEAYVPSDASAALPPPRLVQTGGGGFGFDDGGNAEQEEGYVLRDLDLRCTDCARDRSGVFLYNDIDDVRIERVSVRGFGIGIYVSGSQPCSIGDPDCDGMSSRVTLSQVDVRDNHQHGFLGAGNDLSIVDSHFENNGSEPVLDHNIYLGGNAARIRILRNTLYRSAALTTGSCRGSSLVAHGNLAALLVEGNLIREDLGAATGNCWGIDINPGYENQESFHAAIVRGNTILNVGTSAIALGACIDCLVENNVVVHAQPHAIVAIRAPATQFGPGDAMLDRLVVRNNSIHVATTNSVGIAVGGEGSNHVVVGNAIESIATSGFWSCLSLDLPAMDYASVDHNVCDYVEGSGRAWEAGSGALAAWRATSNLDTNSVFAPPGFAAATSPAFDLSAIDADAAMVGRGDPVLGAPNDYFGIPRAVPPDAGAFQWSSASATLFGDGFEEP